MATPVNTIAAGGLAVVDVSLIPHYKLGVPVSEAAAGKGIAVTKVTTPSPGLAVVFVVPPP